MLYTKALSEKWNAIDVLKRKPSTNLEERNTEKGQIAALRTATPYYWSQQIAESVVTSARSLPDDTALSLETYKANTAGWYWFASPITSLDSEPVNAILWCVVDTPIEHKLFTAKRSIFLSTFAYWSGLLQPRLTVLIPELIPLSTLRAGGVGEGSFENGFHRTLDSPVPMIIKFMISALLWIDQKILITEPSKPNHTARHQARRYVLAAPDIQVVTLRRKEHSHDSTNTKEVEWTCQWVVSGHWRQQYYPSTGERRPLWITPYIKGPENKPLKPPSPKIFAVTR